MAELNKASNGVYMTIFLKIFSITLIFISLLISCEKPQEEKAECYRCTYERIVEEICPTNLVYEICVLRPHESSLQMVWKVKKSVMERRQILEKKLAL